ncbi:MAG: ABC transporter permease [Bdellovibrionales bacterium]|nr:ABC transporter permease [Bdellovibrionales bacterium]
MSRNAQVLRLLAWKFLLSKSSDAFISLITWVSVVGVALGVLALTVVTSVINGFEGELQRVITGMHGDLVLYSRAEPFSDIEQIEQKIRQVIPEARAISPSLVMELMVSGPDNVAGAVVEGLDWTAAGAVTEVPRRLIEGAAPVQQTGDQLQVALGDALASRIGAKVGDSIRIVIPFSEGDLDATSSSKIVPAKVTGIVKMGMYEYDSKFVFAPLSRLREVLGAPGQATSMKIRLKDGSKSRWASDRLSESFGYPFRAKDWGQLNRNLFYAIQLEKAVISVILLAIILVAAFNVVSTLMMLMHDKTRELAILKAMGFSSGQAFKLFVVIGSGIGLIGASAGAGLGLLGNQALSRSRVIELPPDIYYIGFLPVVTRWSEVFWIVLGALLICLMATLYPALRVARRSPLEGIVDV